MKTSTQTVSNSLPRRPSLLNQRSLWTLLSIVAIAWSLSQAGLFSGNVINPGGWSLFLRFLRASLHPDLSPELLSLTLSATLVTLAYAICGTALSVLLGLVGGVLASQVWWQSVFLTGTRQESPLSHYKFFWLSIRALLSIPRAIHELLWGLFFVNIFGLDPLVAILAITIPFGAITAKVFSEILDETPRQPLIVLLNSGVSPLKAFIYTLIPQAFPYLLSYIFYRFECSIRSAAVLGIIGAGGLGYQILLSLQSLRYEQMWTFFSALFVLNAAVDFWSATLRRRLGFPSRLDLNFLKLHRRQISYQTDPVVFFSIIGAICLLLFSFWTLKIDYSKLWASRTVQLLAEIVQEMFPPNIYRDQLGELFNLSTQTVAMSVLAIAVASLGGILLSFGAAYNFLLPGGVLNPISRSKYQWFWGTAILLLTRSLLLIFRAIPAPIWALILLFVLFPGILPGAIALGLHNLGILGRLMAEVIENLDERPTRSLQALGASGSQVFLYGVLPNTLPRFLAYTLYRWEVCMRETVIVGLVGAGGLGRLLTEQLSSFDYKSLLTTLLCFVVITFLVDLLSASARRSLR